VLVKVCVWCVGGVGELMGKTLQLEPKMVQIFFQKKKYLFLPDLRAELKRSDFLFVRVTKKKIVSTWML
jgi:hypothetical protein